MTGCSSSANSVSLYGGVVHVESGTARILNCTFGKGYYLRNNSAGDSGGAIFAAGGDIAVLNSTITANAAALSRGGYGGGPAIDAAGSAICRVGNTIIAGNTAMTGERGAEIAGAFVSLGHNLIGEAEGGTGYAPTDLLGSLDTPLLPLISLSIDDGGGPASPDLTYIPYPAAR
ncbi:MAG: hypothetical protein KA184_05730 [Candidatus Hydrogenedentes bacterium]|nr:hypothetical protein [Candidatus Hydrogenedentota bacterium]